MQGLSDELIRKLPQRVQLSTGLWKHRLQALIITFGCAVPLLGCYFWWPIPGDWIAALAIFLVCWAGVHALVYQSLQHVVEPILFARGLLPNVEYLPQDDQVILTDLGGIDALFRPEARVIFYLSSLSAVAVRTNEKGRTTEWQVVFVMRKGEEHLIISSRRGSQAAAHEIAKSLAAMLNLPLR